MRTIAIFYALMGISLSLVLQTACTGKTRSEETISEKSYTLASATELIARGEFGKMVAMQGDRIVAIPLEEVTDKIKTIPLDNGLLQKARNLGTCFGDNACD